MFFSRQDRQNLSMDNHEMSVTTETATRISGLATINLRQVSCTRATATGLPEKFVKWSRKLVCRKTLKPVPKNRGFVPANLVETITRALDSHFGYHCSLGQQLSLLSLIGDQ